MINVKELLRKKSHPLIFRRLVKNDSFCNLFGIPEFYFDNIRDYVKNVKNVKNGMLFLLPKINYNKKGEIGQITDTTGKLNGNIITTFADAGLASMLGAESVTETLNRLSNGHNLYHVTLRKEDNLVNPEQFYQSPLPFSQEQGMNYLKKALPCLKE